MFHNHNHKVEYNSPFSSILTSPIKPNSRTVEYNKLKKQQNKPYVRPFCHLRMQRTFSCVGNSL